MLPSPLLPNCRDGVADFLIACAWCPSPCGNYYCCDGPTPYCGYLTNPFECVCWGPV